MVAHGVDTRFPRLAHLCLTRPDAATLTCGFVPSRFATSARLVADSGPNRAAGPSRATGRPDPRFSPRGEMGAGGDGFKRSRRPGCADAFRDAQEHAAVLPARPCLPRVRRAAVAVQPGTELLEAHRRVPLEGTDGQAEVAARGGV